MTLPEVLPKTLPEMLHPRSKPPFRNIGLPATTWLLEGIEASLAPLGREAAGRARPPSQQADKASVVYRYEKPTVTTVNLIVTGQGSTPKEGPCSAP